MMCLPGDATTNIGAFHESLNLAAATMTLTLSIGHRAVDGATASGFLARLEELTEEPLDIVLCSQPGILLTIKLIKTNRNYDKGRCR